MDRNILTFPARRSRVITREAAELAIRAIRTRTEQGIDRHGREFAGYSADYGRRKAAELGPARVVTFPRGGAL